MSVPVVLAIMLDVQAALRAITVAGGYHYDVKSGSVVIDPEPLELVAPTEVPYIVIGDVTPGTRDFAGSRPTAIKDTFTIGLSFRVDAPGTDRARKETAGWNFAADVEVALSVDKQRGLRALYTYVEQPTIYAGVPGVNQVYGEIPVRITLQRAYGTP